VRNTLIVLAALLGLTFAFGIYWLTYELSGDPLAGIIAVFLGSLSYRVLGGVQLGFSPPRVIPRNFVVALAPIIIVLFLRWRASGRLWLLFALLGLMANFHALASLHLTLMLTLVLLLVSRFSWAALKQLLLGGCAAVLCAILAILRAVPILTAAASVSSEQASVLHDRYAFAVRVSWIEVLFLVVSLLPLLVLCGLGFYRALRRPGHRNPAWKAYFALWLVTLLLPWVGPLLNTITLSFSKLELLRVTRYYPALGFAPAAVLMSGWMRMRKRGLLALAPVCIVLIAVVSRPQITNSILTVAFRGLGVIEPEPSAPAVVEVEDSQCPEMLLNWQSFSDLSQWADSETPKDALFVMPPDWSWFWVYGRRSLFVAWKGAGWPGWAERYAAVQEAYDECDTDGLVELADEHDVDFVVVRPGIHLSGLEIAYENQHYVVYRVR
jgi:hypothetical protein